MTYRTEIAKQGKWQMAATHVSLADAVAHIEAHLYYPDYPVRVVRFDGQRSTVVLVESDLNQMAKAAYLAA